MSKFVYVLEDGEIEEKIEVNGEVSVDFVNYLCDAFFDEEFQEVGEESGGLLYTVSDIEMVFVCDKDVENVEDLWV